MDWISLLNSQRLLAPPQTSHVLEGGRSEFHRDHDRIVFSSAFRRLGRKTQVHPMSENDHVHTRLTHSIEVASVGRSLGMIVGEALQKDLPNNMNSADVGAIVQAACLAHDIGNPPFGHAGEFAIRDWFRQPEHQILLDPLDEEEKRDLQTFEGNAQGFRVITQLENHRFEGGLRLTFATLGSTLKYPWLSKHAQKHKFSCYRSEAHNLFIVANALGLTQKAPGLYARHPLSYLMEAADDICYAILDLEDGIEIGLLNYDQVSPLLIQLSGGANPELAAEIALAPSARRKISLLRGKAISRMINSTAHTFLLHQEALMAGEFSQDLLYACPQELAEGILAAKELARNKIFNDRRKVEVEVGSYATLNILLSAFCGAAYQLHKNEPLSFRHKRILDLMEYSVPDKNWPLYDSYMRVMDFIGGMTDNYATYLAKQIAGMG